MAGDPYYNNVSLLLHGNGADGSTTITDSGPVGHTVTANGNAHISTAQILYGSASLKFDGAGDYLVVPYHASIVFDAGDFTIEGWLYKLGNHTNGSRLWNANGDVYCDMSWSISSSGTCDIYLSLNGSSWFASLTGPSISNNAWHHIAVTRQGGTAKLFVDGTPYTISTGLGTTALYNYTGNKIIGGQAGTDRPLNGYMHDFRATKGVARYTAAFTPPAAEFPDVQAKVSGLVRDSSNALCARTVRAYDHATGVLLGSTTSNATTGIYTIDCATEGQVNVICLDDSGGTVENDLILRTTPE